MLLSNGVVRFEININNLIVCWIVYKASHDIWQIWAILVWSMSLFSFVFIEFDYFNRHVLTF